MDDRRALLRRKIELLETYLRDGIDAELAAAYLEEITRARRELRELDAGKPGDRRS